MLRVNSKLVEPGDTFIAIKAPTRDGHDFIDDAISRGAACIIAERGEYKVKTIIVPDTRKYLADYLKDLYSDKLKDIKLIGITGTNGKTTSCYLIYQMLNKLGVKTAYIGTIGFYLPERHKVLANTTPDLYDLYSMFAEASDDGCSVIAMEVSSQALAFRRLLGIEFDYVCFTNLTEDHLDFHKTMENYEKAKLMLFDQVKDDGYAIINMDDPYGKDFVLEKNNNILFGSGDYDYKISDIVLDGHGCRFRVSHNGEYDIDLPIPGSYNVHNYMYLFIICNLMGLSLSDVIRYTLSLKAPNGRYQVVSNDKYCVIIDYAHTPDAVLNILKSVREYATGKIYTIVGCGGDRDPMKRPIMGKIATDNSDYVIFTSDNPRTEDPHKILDDIVNGLEKDNYEVIEDRRDAIKKGISLLNSDDILLVLGKGHEDYQIIGNTKYHLSDLEEVKKYVK